MGLILFVAVIALCTCLPIKCYNDGQYKMRCLEMHGTLEIKDTDQICHTEGGSR